MFVERPWAPDCVREKYHQLTELAASAQPVETNTEENKSLSATQVMKSNLKN